MNEIIRISGLVEDSVVDGIGIRLTVFTQGCPHRCEGCHNPQTHDLDGGFEMTITEIVENYKRNPLLDGITLSGGEPFIQAAQLAYLAKKIHELKGNVWCYTGYTYEELLSLGIENDGIRDLLNEIDVLVDGRFLIAELDLMLKFRGSKNQRILDMNLTRISGVPKWLEGVK